MKVKNSNTHKEKYLHLRDLGSELGLSFSRRLVVGDKIIALDRTQMKLLVCEFRKGKSEYYIVELHKVESISLQKIYRGIKAGELNEIKFEEFIKTIQLRFEYSSKEEATILLFYQSEIDDVADLIRLEMNLKDLQLILSKMIGINNTKVFKEIDLGQLQTLDKCAFQVATVCK